MCGCTAMCFGVSIALIRTVMNRIGGAWPRKGRLLARAHAAKLRLPSARKEWSMAEKAGGFPSERRRRPRL